MTEITPRMLKAAWTAFRGTRTGPLLREPGPALREALEAALSECDEIERLRDEVERLEAAIKAQANAVKILDQCKDTELANLRKTHHEAKAAAKTLNSEREANALLTEDVERLRAALKRISELDVPRTVRRAWRQDGAPSRHDACPYDLRMYEDCYACIAEYAAAVLEGKEKGDGA